MNMQYLQGLETRKSRPHPSGNKYTMSPTLGEPNVSETELVDLTLLKIFGPTPNKKSVTAIKNGHVYDIRFTKDNMRQFGRYRPYFEGKVSHGKQPDEIPTDKHLIVKLVLVSRDKKENKKQPQPEMYTSIAKEISREIRILDRLRNATSKTIADKKYDIKRVIPKLYYGGFDGHVGLIIMEKLPGTTLTEVLQQGVSPETLRWIIAKFEYALCCLFLNGYIHGDLHSYNVQIDLHNRSVYLIDFGRTITMTPELVKDFERYLVQHRQHAIMQFWKNKAEPYGNAAVYERAKKYPSAGAWWSNVDVVSRLATVAEREILREGDPSSLKALRDQTWVPEKPVKPPPVFVFRERQQQLNNTEKKRKAEQQLSREPTESPPVLLKRKAEHQPPPKHPRGSTPPWLSKSKPMTHKPKK